MSPRAKRGGAAGSAASALGRPPGGATGSAVALAVAALVALLAAAAARSESMPEPPPEEPEGADYEAEPADSLAEGTIEMGVGAAGRAGARPRQSRRVRISDRTLGGTVREGSGDPLAGGTIEAGALAGRLSVGRLAPRWGRGLVLGAAAEPWSAEASDRGATAPYRGRAGRGAQHRLGDRGSFETLYGRFARRDLGGARLRLGGLGLGALADRSGHGQASVSLERGHAEHEIALDRAGRWRAEMALRRAAGSLSMAARVRGGLAGFRSLAEPQRSGPAQAMALDVRREALWGRAHGIGALWRFAPGLGGARVVLEAERRFNQHDVVTVGFEERHGTQREDARRSGFRQGGWGEWRCARAGLALAVRHEVLGARRLGRAAMRTVTVAQLEAQGPAGTGLRVTHSVYRVRPGESLYLSEVTSDRVVLRAVTGTGRRTRVELRGPGAGGYVRAALEVPLAAGPTRSSAALKPRWTLDWTRRARSR